MSSSAHYSTVMSLKYRVKRFHFEVLCNTVRHVAQLGNCWCFVVTLAGMLAGHRSRFSPGGRHSAFTSLQAWSWPLWAGSMQAGWMAAWVSCELSVESIRSAGSALLVKNAKGPATLLYEEHVVRRVRSYIVCAVAKLWSLSRVQGTLPKRESLCFHWFVLVGHGLQECYCVLRV